MQYAIMGIDDAEQNIFDGLLTLSEIQLPAEWAEDAGEEDLLAGGYTARDVMNGPIDIEVECWGRRLA